MKKFFYLIIALIIIAGGYYFYDQKQKPAKAPETTSEPSLQQEANRTKTPSPTASQKPTPTLSSNSQGGTFSGGDQSADVGSNIQVYEVSYDGSKFTPASIDINQNDWIFFKNNSTKDFWPASGPHPFHADYPAFDAKAPIAPGKTFKFQFTKIGSWHYHDHLNESVTGVVNVK